MERKRKRKQIYVRSNNEVVRVFRVRNGVDVCRKEEDSFIKQVFKNLVKDRKMSPSRD
jgi:hypothetical protein